MAETRSNCCCSLHVIVRQGSSNLVLEKTVWWRSDSGPIYCKTFNSYCFPITFLRLFPSTTWRCDYLTYFTSIASNVSEIHVMFIFDAASLYHNKPSPRSPMSARLSSCSNIDLWVWIYPLTINNITSTWSTYSLTKFVSMTGESDIIWIWHRRCSQTRVTYQPLSVQFDQADSLSRSLIILGLQPRWR